LYRILPVAAWLTLGTALASPCFAGAADAAGHPAPRLSPTYETCMKAAAGVTVEMHDCIDAEYARQDARLNQTYQAVLARLSDDQTASLREGERAWLRKTRRLCDHAGDDNAGGTLQAIEIADCQLTETAKRADALARYRP
jgi:uncharacterized protein YecT (DUF1311 family)